MEKSAVQQSSSLSAEEGRQATLVCSLFQSASGGTIHFVHIIMLSRITLGLCTGPLLSRSLPLIPTLNRNMGTMGPSLRVGSFALSPSNVAVPMAQGALSEPILNISKFLLTPVRQMNRNARRPKRANHGKRPVSHARQREKAKQLKSRAYRKKIFGFW